MKAWKLIPVALVAACCYVHRRAIMAVLTGSEMPKAPEWHVWVPEEMRSA